VRALVSGSLRWHPRLAWQAGQLLHRPLPARESRIAGLLRIGLFQLQFMRVPEHAAVSATVAAADLLGRRQYRGLLNALLRRFLRERERLDAAMRTVAEAETAHPLWLLERLQRDWPDRWPAIVAADNALPPMWLRVNLARISRAEYAQGLQEAGFASEASPSVPSALRLAQPQPAVSLPGYVAGLVSVQDAAAQLAAQFLSIAPGQRILDACAAPGGKSSHLLESCAELSELVALDHDAARVATLRENFARLGQAPTVIVGDAGHPAAWWNGRVFDRILLDAPCSALGVVRRHPDIKVLRRAEDVPASVAEQQRLLDALWPLLAPGGRLLYATCSVLRQENHDQVAAFLARWPDAERVALGGRTESEVQILPGEADMDGFYYACLGKQPAIRS
jgi:16S rRNA (cytosine967-C5)-methyltransferase